MALFEWGPVNISIAIASVLTVILGILAVAGVYGLNPGARTATASLLITGGLVGVAIAVGMSFTPGKGWSKYKMI